MGLTNHVQFTGDGAKDLDRSDIRSESGAPLFDSVPRRYVLGAAGEIELDCATYQLTRHGISLPIEPKAFDVLRYLIEHRERVVPNQELFAKFWPPHISAGVLSHYIVAARKILGDDVERQQLIKTIRGRGYQFIGDVSEQLGQAPPESAAITRASLVPPPIPREYERALEQAEPTPAAEDVLLGRTAQLGLLDSALDRANRGQGRVALIAGETGIGKTRLLHQLAVLARRRGALVLSCRCTMNQAAPPFRPWTQLLRAALKSRVIDVERDLPREAVRELATLLPELGPQAATPTDPLLHDELARARMFDALCALIQVISERQLIVLSIDDLHAADASSLAFFAHVVDQLRESRVLLACAYRDDDTKEVERETLTLIDGIAGRPECYRIELDGLDRADVVDLMKVTTGVHYTDELASRVHALSSGNPFFIQELSRWMSKNGVEGDEEARPTPPLPRSIRNVVEQRMAMVSFDTRQLLLMMAALAQPAHVSLLAEALAIPRDVALKRLDEACRARIVTETRGNGCYELSHGLLRAALEESMSAMQRARLHKALAETLELNPRSDRCDMIAYHLRMATPAGDGPLAFRALQASMHAAERAFAHRAYEKCASECEAALALLELDAMSGVEELEGNRGIELACKIALQLGRAHAMASCRHASRKAYTRAAALARSIGRADLLAYAAIGLAGRYTWGVIDNAHARAALEEARDNLVSREHDQLRVHVLGVLAGMLGNQGARQKVAAEAMAITAGSEHNAVRVRALVAQHHALLGPDHMPERASLTAELRRIADQSGDHTARLWASYVSYIDHLSAGQVEAAKEQVDLFVSLAQQLDHAVDAWLPSWAEACRAHTFLPRSEAKRVLELAANSGDKLGHPGGHCVRLSAATAEMLRHGCFNELDAALGPQAATSPWVHRTLCAIKALGYAERGDIEATRAALDKLAPTLDDVPRDEHWLPMMTYLGAAAARIPGSALAPRIYAWLTPFSGRLAVDEVTFMCSGPVDSILTLLASALDLPDEAEMYAQRALVLSAKLADRVFLAIAQLSYVQVLVTHRRGTVARQRAHELAQHALANAVLAQSDHWAERARAAVAGF